MPAPPTSATRRLRRLGRQLRVHHPPAGAGPAAAALAEDDAATLATELGLRCNTLSPWGFGVQIEGFDTSRPAAPASAALLRSLLAKHKLLLIRGGRLDAPQLADLGRSLELGEAETFGAADYVDVDYMSTFPDEPNVMQIEYGPHSAPADINIWHMDHSWHVAPTRYELSYADVSPATGGDVIFADTCAAYETLSPLMQDMLSGATCLNILANGYQNLEMGSAEYAQTMLSKPGVEQPVLSKDAETGALSLNVNESYSVRIVQLTKAESGSVLPMLCEHVTRAEHCLRIHYEVGDICLFDNHKIQHYAVSDYHPHPRRILRMSFAPQKIIAG